MAGTADQEKLSYEAAVEQVFAVTGETKLDPMTIAVIVQIILQLIQTWQDCKQTPQKNADDVFADLKQAGFVTRVMVRRAIIEKAGHARFRRWGGPSCVQKIINLAAEQGLEQIEHLAQLPPPDISQFSPGPDHH